MIKFDVHNCLSGNVQFTAEIDCADDAPISIKLGLAVRWAVKTDANLAGAYLAGAYLAGAYLAGANFAGAYLAGANFAGANFAGANFAGANFAGANLAGANFAGANLAGAKGINSFVSFGPVGRQRRYGWATLEDGKPVIRLGCHKADLEQTCAAICEKYGKNSTYEALVRSAVAEMLEYAPKAESEAA